MRGRSLLRAGAAAVAMVLVAEGAVWLLRPRPAPIAPISTRASEWFTAAQIDRGRAFDDGQDWLYLATLGVEAVVLVVLASGRPRAVDRTLARTGSRPVAGTAAAGAGVAIVVAIATLPVGLAAHDRAVDYGLSVQSTGSWLGDAAKAAAIGAVIAAAAAALLGALVRRLPRTWWVPGTGAVVAIAAAITWIGPVVLAPLFNKFEKLPSGSPARAQVLRLARKAGVEVGGVYRVNASRKVRALNAYVDGIGSTRRVVLYDNLLSGTDRAELEAVVAHELGHVKHDDILRGLAFVALVAPLGLVFAGAVAAPLARRAGFAPGSPGSVPAYFLATGLAALILGVPGNQLSRQVEASADSFALDLTHEPRAFIALQRKLTARAVADPDPPAIPAFLLDTHPSAVDRIGAALAYERRSR
jgi:Zn-dependent protease with chaperone function